MPNENESLSVLIIDSRDLIQKGMRVEFPGKRAMDCVAPGKNSVLQVIARLQDKCTEILFMEASVGAKKAIARALGFLWESGVDSRLILMLEENSGTVGLTYVIDCKHGSIVRNNVDQRTLGRVLDAVMEGGVYLPESGIRRLMIHALPKKPLIVASRIELSPVECGVLYYLDEGRATGTIAYMMNIEEGTVKMTYLTIVLKLLRGRTENLMQVSAKWGGGVFEELREGEKIAEREAKLSGSSSRVPVAKPVAKKKDVALAEVRRLVQIYGIHSAALFPPEEKNDLDYPIGAPRYLNPVSGATWNGRGRLPRWLQGVDRSIFAV